MDEPISDAEYFAKESRKAMEEAYRLGQEAMRIAATNAVLAVAAEAEDLKTLRFVRGIATTVENLPFTTAARGDGDE